MILASRTSVQSGLLIPPLLTHAGGSSWPLPLEADWQRVSANRPETLQPWGRDGVVADNFPRVIDHAYRNVTAVLSGVAVPADDIVFWPPAPPR